MEMVREDATVDKCHQLIH